MLAGGTVVPAGFQDRFKVALQANDLPVKLSEVRVSTEPLNVTARGALMAALCLKSWLRSAGAEIIFRRA